MGPESGGIISAINNLIPGGIANVFNLGLGIGAILALGTILYAGILYSVAGDNASKQKEAKAWIIAAIKGLALIALGVALINIINPRLQEIQDAEIQKLRPVPTPPARRLTLTAPPIRRDPAPLPPVQLPPATQYPVN